jgi:hypothetical protein
MKIVFWLNIWVARNISELNTKLDVCICCNRFHGTLEKISNVVSIASCILEFLCEKCMKLRMYLRKRLSVPLFQLLKLLNGS